MQNVGWGQANNQRMLEKADAYLGVLCAIARACYNCLCTARRQREDDRRQRDVFSNVLGMHRQSGR